MIKVAAYVDLSPDESGGRPEIGLSGSGSPISGFHQGFAFPFGSGVANGERQAGIGFPWPVPAASKSSLPYGGWGSGERRGLWF